MFEYNLKSTNLDDVFCGAGAALNTAYTAANVIVDGWNSIKSCMDSSRRNLQPCNYGYPYGGYGYGYAYGYPQPPMMMGYPYGYPQEYHHPGMTPTVGYGTIPPVYPNQGYFGFTDPGYGMSGDPSFNNGMPQMAPNPTVPHAGPQGSGWLV